VLGAVRGRTTGEGVHVPATGCAGVGMQRQDVLTEGLHMGGAAATLTHLMQ
jgi:hypothetical protein